MRSIITYRVAMAAGQDAGHRSMRKAGRRVWNHSDYNRAAGVVNQLLSKTSNKGRALT